MIRCQRSFFSGKTYAKLILAQRFVNARRRLLMLRVDPVFLGKGNYAMVICTRLVLRTPH